MQIDTRNREHGIGPESVHNCTNMSLCAGYEPRQARYGRNWGGLTSKSKDVDGYSGILECPCNSRYGGDPYFYPTAKTKIVERSLTAIPSGTCSATSHKFSNAGACFDAVAALGFNATSTANKTGSNPALPAGCLFIKNADGSAIAMFNPAGSGPCGASTTKSAASSSTSTKVSVGISLAETTSKNMSRGPKGQYCMNNHNAVIKEFPARTSTNATDAAIALAACEAFCESDATCTVCSVDAGSNPTGLQWAALPSCGAVGKWAGSIPGDISQKSVTGIATITLSGPSDAWFGVGLSAQLMHDQPYTLVVNDQGVMERKLGTCGTEADHCGGTLLSPSVKLVSNSVTAG